MDRGTTQGTLDGGGGNLLSCPHAFGGNPDPCGSWTLARPGDALTGGGAGSFGGGVLRNGFGEVGVVEEWDDGFRVWLQCVIHSRQRIGRHDLNLVYHFAR